jgi:iron(III) transport system substrate-binding protein
MIDPQCGGLTELQHDKGEQVSVVRPIRRKIAACAAAIGLIGALSACQSSSEATLSTGSWEDVVEAANSEGTVSFYSGMSEIQNARLTEAFNEKYPKISVRTLRGAGELYARVESEIQTGVKGADVFALGDTAWFANRPEDFLPAEGPASASWQDEGWIAKGTSAIATTTPNSIFLWNTDVFPEGFETWDDLLDPSVKGKIGLRTDVTKSVAGYLDMMETKLGPDYIQKLGALAPKVYPSNVPMAQAVASGEIGVTNSSLPATIYELAQNGAPIDWKIPNPGYAFEFGIAALKNASNPNAASVFVDFVMSSEGQTAINADGFGGSRGLKEVPGALELTGFSVMDSTKYTPDALNDWEAKLAKYYKR